MSKQNNLNSRPTSASSDRASNKGAASNDTSGFVHVTKKQAPPSAGKSRASPSGKTSSGRTASSSGDSGYSSSLSNSNNVSHSKQPTLTFGYLEDDLGPPRSNHGNRTSQSSSHGSKSQAKSSASHSSTLQGSTTDNQQTTSHGRSSSARGKASYAATTQGSTKESDTPQVTHSPASKGRGGSARGKTSQSSTTQSSPSRDTPTPVRGSVSRDSTTKNSPSVSPSSSVSKTTSSPKSSESGTNSSGAKSRGQTTTGSNGTPLRSPAISDASASKPGRKSGDGQSQTAQPSSNKSKQERNSILGATKPPSGAGRRSMSGIPPSDTTLSNHMSYTSLPDQPDGDPSSGKTKGGKSGRTSATSTPLSVDKDDQNNAAGYSNQTTRKLKSSCEFEIPDSGQAKGSGSEKKKAQAPKGVTKVTADSEGAAVVQTKKVYADNSLNRSLRRVGLPWGSAMFQKSTGKVSVVTYIDSSKNRMLGRVGKPRGSVPVSRQTMRTRKLVEYIDKLNRNAKITAGKSTESDSDILELAQCEINRDKEEKRRQEESSSEPDCLKLAQYAGATFPFSELTMQRKIGQGGFGEVYFAKLQGCVVAVKKLRPDKVSKRGVSKATDEMLKCWRLKHRNIVTFIGACVDKEPLSIVMEYMMMSLYEALHVRSNLDLSEKHQLRIMQQVLDGLGYMHTKHKMAHCDLKPHNILLDYDEGEDVCQAKITDFGLTMTGSETACRIGTPRYMAPEVHLDKKLSVVDFMKCDIYALGLIFYEIMCGVESFYDVRSSEMKMHVGQNRQTPAIPGELQIEGKLLDLINGAWDFNPEKRPKISTMTRVVKDTDHIYVQ